MGTFSTLEEAREYFKGDRFATENGMVLDEFDEGSAVCSLEIGERHKNANGGIMGGVMFTLADFAFAVAANNKHMPTVAQQVSINYLNAAKNGKLTARADCVKDGKTTCVYIVDVTDDSGRSIARFTATGFKL
ncbi:MAG: PaaI family thioesterase [Lachnospiraceae bacterium]|nr:PaaI family thioesterase [Lachnospiraceae bacterium]